MAVSVAIDGFGAILYKNGVALPHGELTAIPFPQVSQDLYDVSHAQSPNHFREYKSGFKDTEELAFEMNYAQSDYQLFKSILDAGVASAWKLQITDENFTAGLSTPYWSFTALVRGVPVDFPIDDKATMTATLKITGNPVFVPGT